MVRSWAMHYQQVWLERARDVDLPAWLRVASLAYGRHRRNGHAAFAPGEIAALVNAVGKHTGELVPNPNVNKAIRQAIEKGFLSPASSSRCLVVPPHAIAGGLGSSFATCPMHSPAS